MIKWLHKKLFGKSVPVREGSLLTVGDLAGFRALSGEDAFEKALILSEFQGFGDSVVATNGQILLVTYESECRADVLRATCRIEGDLIKTWIDQVFADDLMQRFHFNDYSTFFRVRDLDDSGSSCRCTTKTASSEPCLECRGVGITYPDFQIQGMWFRGCFRGLLERLDARYIPAKEDDFVRTELRDWQSYFWFPQGLIALMPLRRTFN